ncbi:sensor histidine kinase [Spirosoma utsteinense]|uniref:histidine kinase n=1 Tax=Spirosoma utsteinense TaxID=2585773 RepID=A0ABR6W984_9BACT|nr:sensor histidine kinase [Spirosoma utsteinense]MBC3787962.1 signal transduction histidine kinase/Na+/proline symporter [Spirosoma utsteinense]MBC3793133.1 signal transduction histidine kinase/Na+/proline symporter [Spirosoma utsteinense]
MNSLTVLLCSVLYLSLLFAVAYWAEQRPQLGRSLVNNPYIYALSISVYCTAWTFYGSVGRAASGGIEFLTSYIGPTLGAPIWWSVQRKIIRICKTQRITSIADFISSRYGKSRLLGVLATLLCVMGMIPYISIQLKAITTSFAVLSGQAVGGASGASLSTKALLISLLLAMFTILFGTRKLEATERHEGMVTAIAFESIVKLVAFLTVGIFVTFFLFRGPSDLFEQAAAVPSLERLFTFNSTTSTANWFWNVCLSMMAILFLPRQFQVAIVENVDEKHLNKAMWLFPLYLFLINLFVLPLTFAGKLLLDPGVDADNYVLALPLQFGQSGLALLAYIGGFSAATSMIIVETIALSVMISNNVVMPLLVSRPGWQARFSALDGESSWSHVVITIRRLTIVGLLLLAFLYYHFVANHYSLVSVGVISFVAVAQFTPAMIGGLYWKRGSRAGAKLGLTAGFTLWLYTLILPSLASTGFLPGSFLTDGPFGLAFLRPYELFGLTGLDSISHALFWSLFFNIGGYVWGALNHPQTSLDHAQAVLFVDVYRYAQTGDQSVTWKGQALLSDLRILLATFFGDERARRTLDRVARRNHLTANTIYADPRVVAYAEKWLAGAIGAASARIIVSSVASEEPLSVDEVIHILKASQELMMVNKELTRKSTELQQTTEQLSQANERLKLSDQQKDDFVSTVTHEIRTPLTSIRALSEILYDQADMDEVVRLQFLGQVIRETERLSRLINQVLDLEHYDSGRYRLTTEPLLIDELVNESIESVAQLARDKGVSLRVSPTPGQLPILEGDRDRLTQVLINLLSNAIKFSPADTGQVTVSLALRQNWLDLSVTDNGVGIDPAMQQLIFEKFYQASNQTVRKPKGSGLGLAISKKIIELHHGTISVSSALQQGARFTCSLPVH